MLDFPQHIMVPSLNNWVPRRETLPLGTQKSYLDAETLIKLQSGASLANALAKSVFPFPGGPYRRRPLGGALRPTNKSGRTAGNKTISRNAALAFSLPAMS